ncbi:hypothetical protein PENTCL1PPCAC_30864, partial [Pristionchus entomophagus]
MTSICRGYRCEYYGKEETKGYCSECWQLHLEEMAERPLQKAGPAVQESSECPTCSDILRNPQVLPCGHSFCATCIKKEVMKEKASGGFETFGGEDDKGLECPACLASYSKDSVRPNHALKALVDGIDKAIQHHQAISFTPLQAVKQLAKDKQEYLDIPISYMGERRKKVKWISRLLLDGSEVSVGRGHTKSPQYRVLPVPEEGATEGGGDHLRVGGRRGGVTELRRGGRSRPGLGLV